MSETKLGQGVLYADLNEPEPEGPLRELTEAECFIIEGALQLGFELDDDGEEDARYLKCSDVTLVEYVARIAAHATKQAHTEAQAESEAIVTASEKINAQRMQFSADAMAALLLRALRGQVETVTVRYEDAVDVVTEFEVHKVDVGDGSGQIQLSLRKRVGG